jgi:hypothetical protein
MNVPTIKLACWLTALASAGGLARYAQVWFQELPEKQEPVDTVHVSDVLNEDLELKAEVKELPPYNTEFRKTFLDMDWTGRPPKKPIERVEAEIDPGPRYEPIENVISVVFTSVSRMGGSDDPGGSYCYATYKKERKEAVLRVGDQLMPPYDYAVVHGIKERVIVFAFTDPDRPNEELYPSGLIPNLVIAVGPGGPLMPKGEPLPKADADDGKRAKTELLARNNYLLGTEYLDTFGADYQRILTEDVNTDTYWKDGKRAGIEIKSVRDGSIASRHGAMAGDVLISINGHKVTSESEAISFVKSNSDKYTAWEVVVLRFGNEETIVYHSEN